MAFLVDIPGFQCFLRAEYAYNLDPAKNGKFIPVFVFGADSVEGRAVGFYCYSDSGAMFSRLPVSAFVHCNDPQNVGKLPFDYLQLWDCFSYSMVAHTWSALSEMRIETILKDRVWHPGHYMFTFAWYGNEASESAGDTGFKLGHMLKLDNGQFAIQPNNRIKWFDPSFIVKPFPDRPDYKTMSHTFKCESKNKWVTEDSDRYFYYIKSQKRRAKKC